MILLYLDPGSGSFLLQLLIAGLAGLGIAIGASWSKIKRFFNRNAKVGAEDEDDEEDDGGEPIILSDKTPIITTSPVLKSASLLPSKCPNCGAAVRPNEVKWLDNFTAECQYCNMPIKANK